MRTDTADLLGIVLWLLQAIVFAAWALLSLTRHGFGPSAGLLICLGLGTAIVAYRRARAVGNA